MVKRLFILFTTGTVFLLSACGAASVSDTIAAKSAASSFSAGVNGYNGSDGTAVMESAAEDSVYTAFDDTGSMTEAEIVKSNMMIVRNADVSVDVGSLEDFTANITKSVDTFGGYFEEQTINNYDSDYSTDRYGYYTLRIPEKNLDAFLNIVDGEASITSKTITSEDVSIQHADVSAHINALETEKDNLLRLMEQTTEVSDLVEIENRLADVQYQLDSENSRKRLLEGRVEYSTVRITAHEERHVEHPIRRALEVNFADRLVEGIGNAAEVFVGIVVSIPVIIIVSVFIILFIWILSLILPKIFKRKVGKRIRYVLTPVSDDTAEPEKDISSEERKTE